MNTTTASISRLWVVWCEISTFLFVCQVMWSKNSQPVLLHTFQPSRRSWFIHHWHFCHVHVFYLNHFGYNVVIYIRLNSHHVYPEHDGRHHYVCFISKSRLRLCWPHRCNVYPWAFAHYPLTVMATSHKTCKTQIPLLMTDYFHIIFLSPTTCGINMEMVYGLWERFTRATESMNVLS